MLRSGLVWIYIDWPNQTSQQQDLEIMSTSCAEAADNSQTADSLSLFHQRLVPPNTHFNIPVGVQCAGRQEVETWCKHT